MYDSGLSLARRTIIESDIEREINIHANLAFKGTRAYTPPNLSDELERNAHRTRNLKFVRVL